MTEATDDLTGHWAGLEAGELRCQRCAECGRAWWPPRPVCVDCGSSHYAWEGLPDTAELFTWTVVGRTTLPEFAGRTPYATGVLSFDDLGVRVVGFIAHDPYDLTIGSRMQWTVCRNADGAPRVHWTPTRP